MQEEKIVEFINFINELVDDEFDGYLGVPAKYYFLNGGCLELVKVLKHYIPDGIVVINKEGDHIAIKYKNDLYDATGKIKTANEFIEISDEEVLLLENYLGRNEIKFERKPVNKAIIEELEQCSGSYVKALVCNISI